MTADHPVTDLMNDHRLIEKVMTALERRLAEPGAFPAEFVEQALNFFVEYADHFHHFKEEETLFPAMAKRGVPVEGGPIGMMLHEHIVGRQLLAGIRGSLTSARSGDEQACASIRAHADQYIGLLRNHIWKEDNVLFMMARNVLDGQTAEGLLTLFRAEAETGRASATVEKHAAFAKSLSLTAEDEIEPA
jgi:hemerythrin-like domain-containing protein